LHFIALPFYSFLSTISRNVITVIIEIAILRENIISFYQAFRSDGAAPVKLGMPCIPGNGRKGTGALARSLNINMP